MVRVFHEHICKNQILRYLNEFEYNTRMYSNIFPIGTEEMWAITIPSLCVNWAFTKCREALDLKTLDK